MIAFVVHGTPAPAGSKRGFVLRGKNGRPDRAIVTDDSKRSKPWKASVEAAAAEAMAGKSLLRGPLEVTFRFVVRRPQGHYGSGRNAGQVRPSAPAHPAVKPDVLKLTRAVEDALSGIVYADDAQIVDERLTKVYGYPERCEIRIRPLESQASDLPVAEQTSLLPDPRPAPQELPV